MKESGCDGSSCFRRCSRNISLRRRHGYAPQYDHDSITIGAFGAAQHDVVVSCSTGNSGPDPYTAVNIAPWIITVGALTIDREFPADVTLGDARIFNGVSLYSGDSLGGARYPLVYADDCGSRYCYSRKLDPSKVAGKIIICDRGANAMRRCHAPLPGAAATRACSRAATTPNRPCSAASRPHRKLGHVEEEVAAPQRCQWLSAGAPTLLRSSRERPCTRMLPSLKSIAEIGLGTNQAARVCLHPKFVCGEYEVHEDSYPSSRKPLYRDTSLSVAILPFIRWSTEPADAAQCSYLLADRKERASLEWINKMKQPP